MIKNTHDIKRAKAIAIKVWSIICFGLVKYLQGSISLHDVHTVRVFNYLGNHTSHLLRHTALLDKVLEKLLMLLALRWVNIKASFKYSLYVLLWVHFYLDFVPPQLSTSRIHDRSHLNWAEEKQYVAAREL